MGHRISVSGSLACCAADVVRGGDAVAQLDAQSTDAHEREFKQVASPNERGDTHPATLGAQSFSRRTGRG